MGNEKKEENELLKKQISSLMEQIKKLDEELNTEKTDRIKLVIKIKILENKIDILNQKLSVSRETRIRLLNNAQRIADRNLATLKRHNIVATMLNEEKAKVLDLFEENIILKSELMKDENEARKLKDFYRVALQELDETNKGLLEIIKEYEI